MADKIYLSADQLLDASFRLGVQIWDSGFRPSVLVGIWRGGTPVAIAVHELLVYLGLEVEHYPIRTASYTGIERRTDNVRVLGLKTVAERLGAHDRVLVVDDVFDTGLSLEATLAELERLCAGRMPADVRIATVFYKPDNNRTARTPDYHVERTEHWLVFPHELDGLTHREVLENKPGAQALRRVLDAS